MPSYPAYSGDQAQSVNSNLPADNIPEADAPGWLRYIQKWVLGWIQVEHELDGTHKLGFVGTSYLADNAVTTAKILNDAITTAKILDAAVTEQKIADGAVTLAKLAPDAILTKGIVKLTDQSKTNDSTLAQDSALFFAMEANAKWKLDIDIIMVGGGTTQSVPKWQFNGPAGYSLVDLRQDVYSGQYDANTASVSFSNVLPTVAVEGSQSDQRLRVRGVVINGSTAGTFAFQWAQKSSHGNATTVKKGSYIVAQQLQ